MIPRLYIFLAVAVLCLSLLACSSTIAPSSTAEATTSAESDTFDENDELDSVLKQYENLGKKYNAILADENQATDVRGHAADFLGKMKFIPAIPTLIRHLTLADSTRFVTGDDLESLVCFHALLKYGDLIIPSVINAYLAEPDPIENISRKEDERRQLLLIVIRAGDQKNAEIYFRGLVATGDVRVTKEKLVEWNDHFKK